MPVSTYTYPNGFRLIYEKSNGSIPVTNMQIFVDFGSAYETDDSRGAAHFIEHMCFKGTKRIKESKQIQRTYDRVGAYINAYTDKRYTRYVTKCDSNYTESLMNLFADMLFNSLFRENDCAMEDKIVIEESSKSSDNSETELVDRSEEMLYNGSAFAYPIDTLAYHKKQMDCARMNELYKLFYQPNRISISIVSDLSLSHIKQMLASSPFAKLQNSAPYHNTINRCITPQSDTAYYIKEKITDKTTHISLGFRINREDRHAAIVLRTLIGGPMSSRLFIKLREDNGLTYTSSAYVTYYDIYGDLTLYAETDSTKVMSNSNGKKGVLPLMLDVINDILKNGVTVEEFEFAKGYLKGTMNGELDNNTLKCKHNGAHFLEYPDEPFYEYTKLYDAHYKNITRKEIDDVARKYFRKDNLSVCLIGGKTPKPNQVKAAIKLMYRH
uniref:Peptidase M16 N-terminal domain-containing protein n=1 Tax=viral metagenome TaxID=1070528 RepID=A0A6C0F721_9ZZZZ